MSSLHRLAPFLCATAVVAAPFIPSRAHATAKAKPAHEVDDAVAGKCSCSGPSDCTCKKGECECKSCGGKHRSKLLDPLNGKSAPLRIPPDARHDATAGVFI